MFPNLPLNTIKVAKIENNGEVIKQSSDNSNNYELFPSKINNNDPFSIDKKTQADPKIKTQEDTQAEAQLNQEKTKLQEENQKILDAVTERLPKQINNDFINAALIQALQGIDVDDVPRSCNLSISEKGINGGEIDNSFNISGDSFNLNLSLWDLVQPNNKTKNKSALAICKKSISVKVDKNIIKNMVLRFITTNNDYMEKIRNLKKEGEICILEYKIVKNVRTPCVTAIKTKKGVKVIINKTCINMTLEFNDNEITGSKAFDSKTAKENEENQSKQGSENSKSLEKSKNIVGKDFSSIT
jgi:hypothetical protein